MRRPVLALLAPLAFSLACGDNGGETTSPSSSGTGSTSTSVESTSGAESTGQSAGPGSSSGGVEEGLWRCDEPGKPCDPDDPMSCRPGTTKCINLAASDPLDEPQYRCAEPCSDSEPCSAGTCDIDLGHCVAEDGGSYRPAGMCSGMPMCGGDECDPDIGCGGDLTCLKSGGNDRPPYECRAECSTLDDCPASATNCLGGLCVTDEPYDAETSDWLADGCE